MSDFEPVESFEKYSEIVEIGRPIIGDLSTLEYHTELKGNEIIAINNLKSLIKILKDKGYNADFLENYVIEYMKLKISYNRKSRKEFIELNKGIDFNVDNKNDKLL